MSAAAAPGVEEAATIEAATATDATADPAEIVGSLAASTDPFIVGVRHHSPVLAAAVPALLDAAQADVVLLELPRELAPWLDWLGHPDTHAPVALALSRAGGRRGDAAEGLGFYPFADFSPELAAVRWARERGVPVVPIDLPGALRHLEASADPVEAGPASGERERAWAPSGVRMTEVLLRRFGVADVEELWDRVVEVPSYGAAPEQVRVAALAMGWAMRADAAAHGGVGRHDLRREAWMRREVARAREEHRHPVAVVGAFHAAALVDPPIAWHDVGLPDDTSRAARAASAAMVTSLIPYEFPLLDSRSGYPAGIRDPAWQQAVWAAAADPDEVRRATGLVAVQLCRALRAEGHAAGAPDATEVVRLAEDLARLRGLAAPGRRELVEAVQSVLGQGELLGRGRALAQAAEQVLVTDAQGAVAAGAPRAGLVVEVERVLADLSLPLAPPPGTSAPRRGRARRDDVVDLRLDPDRSPLDRRRHEVLSRLRAMGVVYGEPAEVEGAGGVRGLTRVWTVRWTPATAATLEFAGRHGATLDQAATGALARRARELEKHDQLTPSAQVGLIEAAAECGLDGLVHDWIARVPDQLLPFATLADLVALHDVLERVVADETDETDQTDEGDLRGVQADVVLAGVAAIEGLAGAEELDVARALLAFAHVVVRSRGRAGSAGEGRLASVLRRVASTGSPLMQGAAYGALVILEHEPARVVGEVVGSWIDQPGASVTDSVRLSRRLAGVLLALGPVVDRVDDLLLPIAARVDALTDADFLARLPALREGFDVLAPAARQRFLDGLAERLGLDAGTLTRGLTLAVAPDELVALARADAAGRAAVTRALPGLDLAALLARAADPAPPTAPISASERPIPDPISASERPIPDPISASERPAGEREGHADAPAPAANAIEPVDRWRLVLGRERDQLPPPAQRWARSLDELYGVGRGEGARAIDGRGGASGGGGEAPFPTAREWADELEDLFGPTVREEVLARAVARGRTDALFEVDPEQVEASVELLHHILSLRGALPEVKLGRLRALVDRIVADLVQQLARTLRPALTGLATSRPSRRPVGPLDLRRTVGANLHTARPGPSGAAMLVPERFVFRTRSRRSLDWHVVLVVDVSGSMEVATVYSALVAAVLSSLPALSVRFFTFSTVVADLSDHVDDPLGLLLEVSVGGGTDIGLGLRHAREALVVPSRTIVAVVSDFDEGVSVGRLLGEVRVLAGSGAHLLGIAALDDTGAPSLHRGIAEQVVAAGMPIAALSPLELAGWIGDRVRG